MKQKLILLISITSLIIGGVLMGCDATTDDSTTSGGKPTVPAGRIYFYGGDGYISVPNWAETLGVTVDEFGSFYPGYDNTIGNTEPTSGGADGSDKYLALTGSAAAGWAAGGWDIDGTVNAGTDVTAYKTLVFWAKSANSTKLNWGMEDANDPKGTFEKSFDITGTWKEYKFSLAGFTGVDLTKANTLKFVLASNTAQVDIDEIYFSTEEVPAPEPVADEAPTAGATAPTALEADVISIYSDAYTDITGVNMNPDWGQSGLATSAATTVGTDNIYKYANLNYQGIDFAGENNANAQDVSTKEKLHIDIWTGTNEKSLDGIRIFLISPGPKEEYVDVTTLTKGGWTSIDLNMADFKTQNPNIDLTQIIQIKLDPANLNATYTGKTIYVDNIYFYGQRDPGEEPAEEPVADEAPTTGATAPTALEADVISIYSDAYTDITGVNMNPNWGQSGFATAVATTVGTDNIYKYANLNFQGIDFAGENNANKQDASAKTKLHIDIWTGTNAKSLDGIRIFIVTAPQAGNQEAFADVTTLTKGGWTSIDITLTDFSAQNAAISLADVIQLKLDPKNLDVTYDGKTIYVDNIYFY